MEESPLPFIKTIYQFYNQGWGLVSCKFHKPGESPCPLEEEMFNLEETVTQQPVTACLQPCPTAVSQACWEDSCHPEKNLFILCGHQQRDLVHRDDLRTTSRSAASPDQGLQDRVAQMGHILKATFSNLCHVSKPTLAHLHPLGSSVFLQW